MKSNIKYYVTSLLIGIISTIVVFSIFQRYNPSIISLKNSELKYWKTKALLVEEVNSYIKKVAPSSNLDGLILLDACEEYNVDIKLPLAQGFIESHYGTKGLASKTNSVWNVGAYDGFNLNSITKRFKYDHPNQSIKPYLKLLTTRYLSTDGEEKLISNFVDINGNRYASNTNYEIRLMQKWNEISTTTKIDTLQQQLKYWSIKANR